MNTDERTADFFKALMHPVRLRILAILRNGEECVCHMEAALGLRQAYISQHLTVLREAGVVSVRRDGWNIYYQAIAPGVFGIIDAAAEIATGGKETVGLPADPRPRGCACPKCNLERSKKVQKIDLPRRMG
ncbi:MAG: ArsR/SmtB family transcription factor [Spirochaetia bacterium]